MPAFASHYLFSRSVYKKLDERIKDKIRLYVDYYDLGAQGPDIFFFYKPYRSSNNIIKFGQKVHHQIAKKLFISSVKNIKDCKTDWVGDAALVYLLGLCNHFTLDSNFHPIINKETKNFNEHMLLESELDRRILERDYLKKYKPHKVRRHFFINPRVKYGYSLNLIYPSIEKRFLEESVYQTNFYMKKLYSPHNIKASVIKFLSKRFAKGNDFSNMIIKKDVNDQFDKVITSLVDEYDNTIDKAVENINSLMDYFEKNTKLSTAFNKDFE